MRLLLIVEDSPDIRGALCDLLSDAGYSVCEAADVSSGLRKLRSVRPDLVVLDYGLPERADGEEFLRAKATDPEIASVPLVLVSGFNLPREMKGTVAVIQKPFDVDQLVAVVRRVAGPPEKPEKGAAA